MKWKTLQHNGILFPPDFESKEIRIKIKGENVVLDLVQEEMVYQWAKKKDAPKPGMTEKYVEDPIFQKNFVSDFAQTFNGKFSNLEYSDIDFSEAYKLADKEKEEKELMTKEEKKVLALTRKEIRDRIRQQVGINASIGMASNKLVAKVASATVKPSSMLWIVPGMERSFLSPLGVDCIPGVGPKSALELRRMGVRTVAQLSEVPLEWLEQAYGKRGTLLYLKARGVCESPVVSGKKRSQSISRETTLKKDSVDPRHLKSIFSYLVEKVVSQLREENLYARSVTLKLRYSDFKTVTRCHTLRESTDDDGVVFREILDLFKKLFVKRIRIRLVGVSLSSLIHRRFQQTNLFDQASFEQRDRLLRSIDDIRDKYGFHAILRAGSICDNKK